MAPWGIALSTVWLAAVAILPGSTVTSLPVNPHLFMKQQACTDCHEVWDGVLEEHEFVVDIPDACRDCHQPHDLGRSHPVNVEPDDSEYDIEVPPELPLHDDEVTCGTCHSPHAPWLSRTRSHDGQEPFVVLEEELVGGRLETMVEYFKTFYLRKSDPVEGYAPLCLACHRDY